MQLVSFSNIGTIFLNDGFKTRLDKKNNPNNVGNHWKKYLPDSDVDNIMEIRGGSDLLSHG